jgi:hypothetical protein
MPLAFASCDHPRWLPTTLPSAWPQQLSRFRLLPRRRPLQTRTTPQRQRHQPHHPQLCPLLQRSPQDSRPPPIRNLQLAIRRLTQLRRATRRPVIRLPAIHRPVIRLRGIHRPAILLPATLPLLLPLPAIRQTCLATRLPSLRRRSRPTHPIASAAFGSVVVWAISTRRK